MSIKSTTTRAVSVLAGGGILFAAMSIMASGAAHAHNTVLFEYTGAVGPVADRPWTHTLVASSNLPGGALGTPVFFSNLALTGNPDIVFFDTPYCFGPCPDASGLLTGGTTWFLTSDDSTMATASNSGNDVLWQIAENGGVYVGKNPFDNLFPTWSHYPGAAIYPGGNVIAAQIATNHGVPYVMQGDFGCDENANSHIVYWNGAWSNFGGCVASITTANTQLFAVVYNYETDANFAYLWAADASVPGSWGLLAELPAFGEQILDVSPSMAAYYDSATDQYSVYMASVTNNPFGHEIMEWTGNTLGSGSTVPISVLNEGSTITVNTVAVDHHTGILYYDEVFNGTDYLIQY